MFRYLAPSRSESPVQCATLFNAASFPVPYPTSRETVCGIVRIIGPQKVVPLILDGLRRLEDRGYDCPSVIAVGQDRKKVKSA